MPDCSVYIGTSVVSLALFFEDTSKDPVFYTYPYSFVSQYSTSIVKKTFINELIATFLSEYKLQIDDVNLMVCGSDENFIKNNFKMGLNIFDLFNRDTNNFFVALNTLITHGQPLFASPYLKSNQFVYAENEKLNTLSNFEIYPFNFLNDDFSKGLYDDSILYLSNLMPHQEPVHNPYETGHDVTFTGERFTFYEEDKESLYLLILELLDQYGIYRVKIDTNNLVTHIKNMERNKDKFSTRTKDFIFSLGTVIRLSGPAECYVETHIGTKQVFQLTQNQLITIPLPVGEKAKITVKMPGTNAFESQVIGGNVGIVFFNYPKKKDLFAGLTQSYIKEARSIIREGLLDLT